MGSSNRKVSGPVRIRGGRLILGTGTGHPRRIHDRQLLMQLLHAHTGHMHVTYHQEPVASMLRVSADAQKVRNRLDECDGMGTVPGWSVQEVQGQDKGRV